MLRWEDQQKIKDYVESGSMGTKDGSLSTKVSDGECGIEISKSSRSTCRKCNEKIMKGMVGSLEYINLFPISFYTMLIRILSDSQGDYYFFFRFGYHSSLMDKVQKV